MLCRVQSCHARGGTEALLEATTVYCTAIKDDHKTNGRCTDTVFGKDNSVVDVAQNNPLNNRFFSGD